MKKWIQAIGWELISLLLTYAIGMLFFENSATVSVFVIAITVLKIPLLYLYNRMWS